MSKLLDQRKQPKLKWLQDPSKINGDNLNIGCEACRLFRNKRRECLRDKIKDQKHQKQNLMDFNDGSTFQIFQ
jgi:hypothetical protein